MRDPLQEPFEETSSAEQAAAYRRRVRRLQERYVALLKENPAQYELSRFGRPLMELLQADGFAVVWDDGLAAVGATPPAAGMGRLQEWLAARAGDGVFHADSPAAISQSPHPAQTGSWGLLAFPVPHLSRGYAICFRSRRIATSAGDSEPAATGGLPWSPFELEAAAELRSLITAVILLVGKTGELAATESALRHTAAELEQFAYVTSHDLKAPLRGISSLSKWIEEDLGADITSATSRHLELMRNRVHRMEELIGGILAYLRIGRVTVTTEAVDTGSLVAEIVGQLAPPPGFRIGIAPGMPVLWTERLRLRQVFLYLIDNALKHYGGAEGVVEIAARDAGDLWEFSVRDGGQGIDAKYHGRIFGMFKTLQSQDRIEGVGIGLTLVKKIVESQGGRIDVESAAGAGSVFRFTWPKGADVCATPAPGPGSGAAVSPLRGRRTGFQSGPE